MKFYLGTHMPIWLERYDVPLFVSHVRLANRRTLPRARTGWGCDSGAFSEIALNGDYTTTPTEYAAAVARYRDEIGSLDFAAPQDWMCEDFVLTRTGLTIAEHQRRTTDNYLELRTLNAALPFIPVIQGQTLADYRRHIDRYGTVGIDLTDRHLYPTVGIGSVCRRQSTTDITGLIANLVNDGLALHGFGMKLDGLRRIGRDLASSDSMAWSFQARQEANNARREGRPTILPGCHGHQSCSNCPTYAMAWRTDVIDSISAQPAQLAFAGS